MTCEVEYAYPHYGGYYYYLRCSGSKIYDISLDEIAQSYRDIHETLDSFCEQLEIW